MFELKRRTLGIGFGLVMMSILALGSAATAFADGGPVTATANLGVGALSGTASVVDTAGFVLTGANQIYTYTVPVAMADATGAGLGWKLTISSTQFTSTTPAATLAADASTITRVDILIGTGSPPTVNTATPVGFPLAIGATAVRFFSATLGTGMGTSTITPTIAVAVPGGTLPGSYTSLITVVSAASP